MWSHVKWFLPKYCKTLKEVVMVSLVQMENKFVEASNSKHVLQSWLGYCCENA